jgi:hypothetical protein
LEKDSKKIIIFYGILAAGLISWFLYMDYYYQSDLNQADNYYKHVLSQEINKSYQDILGRSADQDGLENYITLMSEKKMNINDVRRSLEQSNEHKFSIFYVEYGQFVDHVYQETLNRTADKEGLMYYGNLLKNNQTTLDGIRQSLLNSDEGRNVQLSTQLDDLYKTILYRQVDDKALSYYVPLLITNYTTFSYIEKSLLQSDEYKHTVYNNQYPKFVNDLYEQILHRPVDTQGLDYYTSQLVNKTMTIHSVRLALLDSQEHKDLTNAQKYRLEVEVLYEDLLHREADEQGLNSYVIMLMSGKMRIGDVKEAIMSSDEYKFQNP